MFYGFRTVEILGHSCQNLSASTVLYYDDSDGQRKYSMKTMEQHEDRPGNKGKENEQ